MKARIVRWGLRAVAVAAAAVAILLSLDYRDLNRIRQQVVAEDASEVLFAGDATAAGLAALSASNADLLKGVVAGRDHPALTSLAARAALESKEERIFPIASNGRVLNVSVSSSLGLIAAQGEQRIVIHDIASGDEKFLYAPANTQIELAEYIFGGDYLAVQEMDKGSGRWRLALLATAEGKLAVAAAIDLDESAYPLGFRDLPETGWLEIKYSDKLTGWRPFPDGARFDLAGDTPDRVPDRIAIDGQMLAAIMRASPRLSQTARHGIAIFNLPNGDQLRPELLASFDYYKRGVTPPTDDIPADLVFAKEEGALLVAYRDGDIRIFAKGARANEVALGAEAAEPAESAWRFVRGFTAFNSGGSPTTLFRGGLRTIQDGRTLLMSGMVADEDSGNLLLQSFRPNNGSWVSGQLSPRFLWSSGQIRGRRDTAGESDSAGGQEVDLTLDYAISNNGKYAITNNDRSIALWTIEPDGSFLRYGDALSDESAMRFDGAARRRGAFEGYLAENGEDRPPRIITVRRNIGLGDRISTLVRVYRPDKRTAVGWSDQARIAAVPSRLFRGLNFRTSGIDSLSGDGDLIAVASSRIAQTVDGAGNFVISDAIGAIRLYNAMSGEMVSEIGIESDATQAVLQFGRIGENLSGGYARLAARLDAIALHAGSDRIAALDVAGNLRVWGGVRTAPTEIGAVSAVLADSSLWRALFKHYDRAGDFEILWSRSGERLFVVGDRRAWALRLFDGADFAPKLEATLTDVQSYAVGGESLIVAHRDEGGSVSFVAPGEDGAMKVKPLSDEADPKFRAAVVAATRDGKLFAAAGKAGAIRYFGEDAPPPFAGEKILGDYRIVALALSEDGKRTFAKAEDGQILGLDNSKGSVFWARQINERLIGRQGLRGAVHEIQHDMLAVSADGRALCAIEFDRPASLLDARTGVMLLNFDEKIPYRNPQQQHLESARCGFAGAAAFAFDHSRYQVISEIPMRRGAAINALRDALPEGAPALTQHVPSAGSSGVTGGRRLARFLDQLSPKQMKTLFEGLFSKMKSDGEEDDDESAD